MYIIPAAAPKQNAGTRIGARISEGFKKGQEESRKLRELAAKEELDLKRAKALEAQKLAGKKELQNQKFSDINKILSGQQNKEMPEDLVEPQERDLGSFSSMGARLAGQGRQNQGQGFKDQVQQSNGEQKPIPQGLDVSKISDEQIAQVSLIDPNMARNLMHAKDVALREQRSNKEFEHKTLKEERDFHTGYSKKYVEKADKMREDLPRHEMALDYARNAIETGQVGAFSINAIGESIGGIVGDALKNKAGAQLTLAAKEQLIPTLSRVSAKAQNQYMEKRISSMIPKVGQTNEANLSMQEMLEAETLLDRAYLDKFDEMQKEDMKTFGYERKDLDQRVRNAIKPVEKHIAKRTSFRLKELEEKEMGLSKLKENVGKNVPKGTPLTENMAKLYVNKFGKDALNIAEKNGYYVALPDEYDSYMKRPEEYREALQ